VRSGQRAVDSGAARAAIDPQAARIARRHPCVQMTQDSLSDEQRGVVYQAIGIGNVQERLALRKAWSS